MKKVTIVGLIAVMSILTTLIPVSALPSEPWGGVLWATNSPHLWKLALAENVDLTSITEIKYEMTWTSVKGDVIVSGQVEVLKVWMEDDGTIIIKLNGKLPSAPGYATVTSSVNWVEWKANGDPTTFTAVGPGFLWRRWGG